MLITLSSVRGAPGVTSWAALLGAAWPPETGQERVLLEADCAGGVLGARYQLGVEPGALTLIASARRNDGVPPPDHYARQLDQGFWVVPGPEVAEQAVPAWTSGAADLAAKLAADDRLWVADVGRLGPGSPLRPLADHAVLNLVVSGPATEDIVQLPARVESLADRGPTGIVIVGRPPYEFDELRRFLGVSALWIVPADDALPQMVLKVIEGGRARRSALWRAAIDVAADIAGLTLRQSESTVLPADPPGPVPAPAPVAKAPKPIAPAPTAPAAEALPSWPPPVPGARRGSSTDPVPSAKPLPPPPGAPTTPSVAPEPVAVPKPVRAEEPAADEAGTADEPLAETADDTPDETSDQKASDEKRSDRPARRPVGPVSPAMQAAVAHARARRR